MKKYKISKLCPAFPREKSLLKGLFLSVLLCTSLLSNGQQNVNYKVLKDNPADVNNIWLYIDPAQMDIGFKNIDGGSFNLGLWGTATYQERFGADFIFRYGWLTLGKLGGTGVEGEKLQSHRQIELGGYYHFKSTRKKSNTTVILSQKTGSYEGKDVTRTKSMSIPAEKIITSGLRGGIMSMGGVYGTSELKSAQSDLSGFLNFPSRINYNMSGLYLGLLHTNTHNVIIDTDTDGIAAKCKRSRFYIDALILPVSSAKLNDINYKPLINPGMFGFRIGWQSMPSELKKVKEADIKTVGHSFGVEAGMRPFDGIYVTGTWSFCILRKKMPALGYSSSNQSEKN